MKKLSLKWLSMLLMAAMCVNLSACSDDDDETSDETPGIVGPDNPVTPSEGDAKSPEEQKIYLEQVGVEFLNEIKAADFKSIENLLEYIDEYYTDAYEWDAVDAWAEGVYDGLVGDVYQRTTETDQRGCISVYDWYKVTLLASQFHSKFTARNGQWVRSDASNLQFVFTDGNGRECILAVTPSGGVTNLYVGTSDDWYGWDYTGETWYDYYDRTQMTIGVPEKISVTLTQGGNTVIDAMFTTTLSGLSGAEFNISQSSMTIDVAIKLNNGYSITGSLSYKPTDKVTVSMAFVKNDKTLCAGTISSTISGLPTTTLSSLISDEGNDADFGNTQAQNAYMLTDVLGKVQMQGTLTDVRQFSDYLDDADANWDNESAFKGYVANANSLMNVGIFYGDNVQQAAVKLEAFEDSDYYWSEWEYKPVIVFFDGSSYSWFDDYFTDTNFRGLIDAFDKLCDDFRKL